MSTVYLTTYSGAVRDAYEACRRRGINPFDYLRDVFTQMPLMAAADYPSLAPDAWMKERQPTKPISKAPAATDASNQQRRCA